MQADCWLNCNVGDLGSIPGSVTSPGEGKGYPLQYSIHCIHCVHAFSVTSVMSEVFEALWAVALQAPLSMGFSRKENWSGLPRPSPGDLPNPAIKPASRALQAAPSPAEPPESPALCAVHALCIACACSSVCPVSCHHICGL